MKSNAAVSRSVVSPPVSLWLLLSAGLVACLALTACAGEKPQSTTTQGLDTGITSSSGGGVQALGGSPNATVTTRVGR